MTMMPYTLSPTQRALMTLSLLVPLIIGFNQSISQPFWAQLPTPEAAQANIGVSAGQVV
ncbi:MAG: hypothetical protein AABZ45_07045 [Pseudomonadota bacterium]